MSAAPTPVVLLRVDRAAGRHTDHPRHLHPALDLKYIQAGLEAALRIAVPLLDGWLAPFESDAFAASALAHAPRIAVVRAVTWCLEESLAVARILRDAGVITIAVGQQVQHLARTDGAAGAAVYDFCVPGEPEEAVPRLVARLLAGEGPARPGDGHTRFEAGDIVLVRDPDALPRPVASAAELEAYAFPFPLRCRPLSRWGYVLSAWGCPRPCRHCSAIVRKSVGRDLRPRAVAAVVDEVLALRDAGAQAISFEDDSLFVHRARFLELADALLRRGATLPWMANARPDELDAERVAAAAAAGAVLVKVGVDSGSPRLIEHLGKSADGAGWIRATEAGLALLNRHRIGSVALFMVGMPDETPEDAHATLALARRIRPDYLQMQQYRAYPDVPMWPELPARARARAGDYHYLAQVGNCSRISAALLPRLQRRLYRRFYLRPEFVARHLARHWRHYLSPRGTAVLPAALRYLLRGGA